MNKNIIYTLSLLLFVLIGCTPKEYADVDIDKILATQPQKATYTIEKLIKTFGVGEDRFAINKVESDQDVIFNGIITSTDVEGNVYKYLVVQDEAGYALKISIDAGSISGQYPLGQRVSVRCNDLWLGNYAQSPQLGIERYNNKKDRDEPGRIPKLVADAAIYAYGLPEPDAIVVDTMTIAEIKSAGHSAFNKLVCIKDAYFTGKGADFGKPGNIPDDEKIFAPSTGGIGYPQSREIQDGTGSIFVSTSEYAKFANKPLPSSSLKGNITAIVGWYNDKDDQLKPGKIYHQLTLRKISDLGKGFEEYHKNN